MTYFPFIFAIIAVIVLTKLMLPLAKRVGLMALPGGRKKHGVPTPIIGGIAIFFGFCFSLLLLPNSLQDYRAFLAAALLLVLTGVLDDLQELTPRFRLVVQVMTGFLMIIWGGVILRNLGNIVFVMNIELNYFFGFIVSICAVIGVINAVNMLDGVDGLVGTMTLVQFGLLLYLSMINHFVTEIHILLILIGSIIGYLYFNFPFPGRKHAIIFMGEVGSTFLGFSLVWFMIYLSQPPHRAASAVTFLWIMMIPLFDIANVMIRRLLQNRSVTHADRQHIHHLLEGFGFSKLAIVLLLSFVTLLAGSTAILAYHAHIHPGIMFLVFIGLFMIYCAVSGLLWRYIIPTSLRSENEKFVFSSAQDI